MMNYTDTHTHLDGVEFLNDLEAVVQRAKDAGCHRVLIPAIDNIRLRVCRLFVCAILIMPFL